MCQIIWDSQFVHNAHILAVRMQHYSKTASFQEIQCSREVNIYLHNLRLLSDCLIFPSDFPLLFHSTPKLCFKTFSTKKTWLPRRIRVSVILMMQRVLSIIPGSSLDVFLHPASLLLLSLGLHHSQILFKHLCRWPPPLPPASSQVSRTPSALRPTCALFSLIAIFAIVIVPTSTALRSFSLLRRH